MRILTLAALAVLTASQAWAGVTSGTPGVPEPAALGLLAVGVGGLAWYRFRGRK